MYLKLRYILAGNLPQFEVCFRQKTRLKLRRVFLCRVNTRPAQDGKAAGGVLAKTLPGPVEELGGVVDKLTFRSVRRASSFFADRVKKEGAATMPLHVLKSAMTLGPLDSRRRALLPEADKMCAVRGHHYTKTLLFTAPAC